MEILTMKVASMMDIRDRELPMFDQRVTFTTVRLTHANRYAVRQKMDKINAIKRKACW